MENLPGKDGHYKLRDQATWPSASVMDAAGFCGKPDKGRTGPNSGRTLTGKALEMEGKGPHANWPTPTSGRADQQLSPSQEDRHSLNLAMTVEKQKNWPTPKAQNANSPGEHGQGGKDLQTTVGRPDPDKSSTDGKNRGQLNPAWVEQLMGLPPGWTNFDCLETE